MNQSNPIADILIIDDKPENLKLLISNLEAYGYKVRAAIDGHLGLLAARTVIPDLILLDIMMPEIDGYEVCQILKADEQLCDIPVIFISALDQTESKVRGFEVGGADYISKPFNLREVVARIETHLTLHRQHKALQKAREQDKIYFQKLTDLQNGFVTAASHDLKHPLTSIKLAVHLLQNRGDDPEVRAKYLNTIEYQLERMRQLVENLMVLVKLETGRALQYSSASLSDFLGDLVEDFALLAQEKGISLHFLPLVPDLELWCDRQQMRHVVQNLLSNGIKYSPNGGEISIEATNVDSDIQITVKDSGIGIPENDLPHIFEKFYRVNDPRHQGTEGTGLGLAIVKTIIDQHKGQIWVESERDKGSAFHIRLPNRKEALLLTP